VSPGSQWSEWSKRGIGARGAKEQEEQRSTPACSFAPLTPLLHFRGTDSLTTVSPTTDKFTLQIGVSRFHNNTNDTTRHLTNLHHHLLLSSHHTQQRQLIGRVCNEWQTLLLERSFACSYWLYDQVVVSTRSDVTGMVHPWDTPYSIWIPVAYITASSAGTCTSLVQVPPCRLIYCKRTKVKCCRLTGRTVGSVMQPMRYLLCVM
jgi:hypothetical protein